ncbi:hypothetical protein PFAS1_23265 [Pseudomonas frederiksbergensis]|jgi:hypothetical protein|uniref:hypothetical protein n=1 Tax=Pseudomonas frederiksbergensis TaxID=104087 RepID=UPI0009583930|nr:hypothetical protein [Pseudomonas frederiksbergensis]APV42101.1 hypothetical protein PFAS1_23265 [Pseudomonas frederiksbergensis]
MQAEKRKEALETWREILDQSTSWEGAEERYHELVRSADKMEKDGLINSDEWRKLARKAAVVFANVLNN